MFFRFWRDLHSPIHFVTRGQLRRPFGMLGHMSFGARLRMMKHGVTQRPGWTRSPNERAQACLAEAGPDQQPFAVADARS